VIPMIPVGLPVVSLCLPPANGLSSLRDAVDGAGRVAGDGVDHHSGGGASLTTG
jgi:hypothetical protein